ncbi:hypothetical protein EXN66_Car000245 [Channa argus]|uniref:Uncharacterized protein n=1 Tax=Channa argus TaxID=215402 RepID=A0A6G1QWS4_CHAAH|nr:hypothetical protein EXN66_Car000245 [Channa argus]
MNSNEVVEHFLKKMLVMAEAKLLLLTAIVTVRLKALKNVKVKPDARKIFPQMQIHKWPVGGVVATILYVKQYIMM